MQQLYKTGTGVNKVLIVNREIRPNRITMIIVKEKLGFQGKGMQLQLVYGLQRLNPFRKEKRNEPNSNSEKTEFSIHPATRIGIVSLKVANLENQLTFYQQVLGFQLHWREDNKAGLGAPIAGGTAAARICCA